MKFYDERGDSKTYPHYSYEWAEPSTRPYKWTKPIASYFDGTKNGMAISRPARIKDKGGIPGSSQRCVLDASTSAAEDYRR
jgi:arylsulfatase A-like enzyme